MIWLGVLLERVSQTARLLDVHHYAVRDLEESTADAVWLSLLRAAHARLRDTDAGLDHVALAVLAASTNLLLASLTTPQFENFQWPMIYGLLLALAARPLSATPEAPATPDAATASPDHPGPAR